MASGDANPTPKKNAAHRVTFPLKDVNDDLVSGATALDSERSIDGAAFADCSNEAVEIAASSGMYYLDLNASEMNGDTVAIIIKASDAKTKPIALYPVAGGIKEIYSDTSIIYSDTSKIHSETTQLQSDTAAIESEVTQVHSETTVIQSDTTAIESDLILGLTYIDTEVTAILSDTTVIEAWGLSAAASDTSAIESELTIVHSETTEIQGDVDNIYSDTTIIASDLVKVYSDTDNIYSDTTLIKVDTGNIYSDTTIIASDLVIAASDVVQIYSDTSRIFSDLGIEAGKTTTIASDTAVIEAAWTTTLTESYAADGATFTPAQALYQIWSAIAEFSISGTTITAKKLDGSTTSMTFSIDDASDPTLRQRAT